MQVLAKMAMFRRILAYGVFVLGAATQISATTLSSYTEKCAAAMPPAAGFPVHVSGLTTAQTLTGTSSGVTYGADGVTQKDACQAACDLINSVATELICHAYAIDESKNSLAPGNCITYLGAKELNLELQTAAEWTATCEELAGSGFTPSFYIINRQDTCGVLTTDAETYIGLHPTTRVRATAMCTNPNSAMHGSVALDTPKTSADCTNFNTREENYHKCVQREVDAANAKAGVTGTPMTLECGMFVFGSCYNEYSRSVPGDNCCADVKVKMYPNALTAEQKTSMDSLCQDAVTNKALSQEHLDRLKNEGLLCDLGVLSSPAGMLHTPSPFHTFAAGVFMTYLASSVSGLA